jgi:hypothetical protein
MKSRASRRSREWRKEGRGESATAKGLLKFRAEQKATSVIDALNVRRNNVSMETEKGSYLRHIVRSKSLPIEIESSLEIESSSVNGQL